VDFFLGSAEALAKLADACLSCSQTNRRWFVQRREREAGKSAELHRVAAPSKAFLTEVEANNGCAKGSAYIPLTVAPPFNSALAAQGSAPAPTSALTRTRTRTRTLPLFFSFLFFEI
jgi:hypothetical protein